jgi:hypothetical protein
MDVSSVSNPISIKLPETAPKDFKIAIATVSSPVQPEENEEKIESDFKLPDNINLISGTPLDAKSIFKIDEILTNLLKDPNQTAKIYASDSTLIPFKSNEIIQGKDKIKDFIGKQSDHLSEVNLKEQMLRINDNSAVQVNKIDFINKEGMRNKAFMTAIYLKDTDKDKWRIVHQHTSPITE